ncbi:MAG: hypothetical protein ACI351_04965 [Candidatus Avelusimicrobium sp.]|uniref:hypothetical protein n=1 Tax=Candidatus Avelusimicrobium sp. TaxID=3048833 RepID=UPI003F0435C2
MSFGEKEKQLLSSIRHYRTKEALDLLEEKIDLDACGFTPFETPLFLAIETGNKPVLRKLVEKGANVNYLGHWREPASKKLIELSEGHFGQEKNEYRCPLSLALQYEEKHGLAAEVALLRAHGAKELNDLLDK